MHFRRIKMAPSSHYMVQHLLAYMQNCSTMSHISIGGLSSHCLCLNIYGIIITCCYRDSNVTESSEIVVLFEVTDGIHYNDLDNSVVRYTGLITFRCFVTYGTLL